MIPKIIHYCWFGNKKKPSKILKCIDSWKSLLPDYTFMEWNESNFDISKKSYTREAYQAGKYAFVSDVARLEALYEYGGIYLDTDVILYKSFNSILNNECVMGFEEKNFVATSFLACVPHYSFISEFLSYYENAKYGDFTTNVVVMTSKLEEHGLVRNNQEQTLLNGVKVYPQEFFSPYDYINCVMNKTERTICAHLFYVSWSKPTYHIKRNLKYIFVKLLGVHSLEQVRKILKGVRNA